MTKVYSSSSAGLTCIRREAGSGRISGECICVLQLTEAGDVFYQVLEQNVEDRPASDLRSVASDSPSDDNVIGLTQAATVPETPEHHNVDSDSSEDSGGWGRRLKRTQLQVFFNDDPDVATGEGNEAKAAEEEEDEGVKCPRRRRRAPPSLSGRTLLFWKVWLQKLTRRSGEKKLDSQLFVAKTKDLLWVRDVGGAEEEEELLRRELRSCMSSRSLLLRGAVSCPAPLPNRVDALAWRDALSQRLNAAWQGEEAWRAWWSEHLGLNRKSKLEALWRKRRREKEARRTAGQQMELSGSFTSSVSYQAELDDFSNSGWSSAASQGAWSDVDDGLGVDQRNSFPTTPGSSTPSNILMDPLVPTVTPSTTHSLNPAWNPSLTPSLTPSKTRSLTPSLTRSLTPSMTPALNQTQTPSLTPSLTSSLTPSMSPARNPSLTPSLSLSRNPSQIQPLNPSLTHALTPALKKVLKDHPAPSLTELPETSQSSQRTSRPLREFMDSLYESQVR